MSLSLSHSLSLSLPNVHARTHTHTHTHTHHVQTHPLSLIFGHVEVDQIAAQRRYASRQGTKRGSGESWLNGAWETHHAEDRSCAHCSKAVLKVVK